MPGYNCDVHGLKFISMGTPNILYAFCTSHAGIVLIGYYLNHKTL